ncbi:MAG: hypothetical protein P1P85_02590 [Patescibacteria group bacterium]|nr:hypothetical protein [Patescibacteria group bacterium]
MKNLIKSISALSIAAFAFAFSYNTTFAAVISTWGAKSKPAGVPTDIRAAIMNLTNWILGFVSIIATLVIIYGGVQYLTAGGNEDAVGNAKKTISYGIIGIVIAGLAYAMVIVVSTVILQA